jgi:hypothetical protein
LEVAVIESHEPSVVVPAQSEIDRLEQQIEEEIVQLEHTVARRGATLLADASSFATAMLATLAGVVVAGVVAVLFLYAFFIATPVALAVLLVATAVSVRRARPRPLAR